MRVGILTFSEENNFGAMLQAYALQEVIRDLGHQAEIIRYPGPSDSHRLFEQIYTNGLQSLLQSLKWTSATPNFYRYVRLIQWHLRNIASRGIPILIANHRYERFRQQYHRRSPVCTNETELRANANRYDAIVVGSDQVWNSEYTVGWGRGFAYLLSFAKDLPIRRVSYAASAGHPQQLPLMNERAPDLLKRFDRLSVRDECTLELLRSWGQDCSVPIVADPTLLSDFAALPKRLPRHLPQRYILTYSVPGSARPVATVALATLRRDLGLPVVSIVPTAHTNSTLPGADVYVRTASPPQFVSLFSQASYVLTDSFHGAIFAIKNRVPFTVYADSATHFAHRTYDLMHRYGLDDRIVCSVEAAAEILPKITECAYGRAHRLIDDHVSRSIAYLRAALN